MSKACSPLVLSWWKLFLNFQQIMSRNGLGWKVARASVVCLCLELLRLKDCCSLGWGKTTIKGKYCPQISLGRSKYFPFFLFCWLCEHDDLSVCLSVCLYTSQFPWCSDPGLHHGKFELPWEWNLLWTVVRVTTSWKIWAALRMKPVVDSCEGHYVMEKLSCPYFWKLPSILAQLFWWVP